MDLDTDAVDAILESGNPDAINNLLDRLASEDPSAPDVTPPAAPAAAAPESSPEPVILTKAGVPQIPFSELQGARQEASQFRNRAAELEQQLSAAERKMEAYREQLVRTGVTPKVMPEEFVVTDELRSELEGYGQVGDYLQALEARIEALSQTRSAVAQAAPPSNPVDAVVVSNKDLDRWSKSESDWAVAVRVDDAVAADPAFAGKSLADRIPEVVRRVKLALGEAVTAGETSTSIDAKVDELVSASARKVPTSLTEVGGLSPNMEKTEVERLETMDTEDIHRMMLKMSPREVDALLARIQ